MGVQLCNYDKFFFQGREDPNTTKSGPSSANRWRADVGPTLNAGLIALRILRISGDRTSIAKKPYIL